MKDSLQTEYFAILEKISAKLGHQSKLEDLLNCLCEQLAISLDLPGIWIEIKGESGSVRKVAKAGVLAECLAESEVCPADTPFGQGAAAQGEVAGQVRLLEVDGTRFHPWLPAGRDFRISTLLSIPVMHKGREAIGAIYILSKNKGELCAAEIAMLKTFTVHISLIIDLEKTREGMQKLAQKVSYLINHDTLTELPNRTVFTRKLKERIKDGPEEQFAVFILDIDRFKYINDYYSPETGDLLLMEVAKRIKHFLTEDDLICRFGGDEFAVLVNSRANPDKIYETASKIINRCYQEFKIRDLELYITVSIGIALYPEIGQEADALIRYADMAMYSAKKNGGNRYQVYVSSEDTQSIRNCFLLGNLNIALEKNEYRLYYQPQQDLKTGRIQSVEALIRWYSSRGLIYPGEFISLAEDTGLIIPIGEWVIKTACKQNKIWQDNNYQDIRMSVNISARQFYQPEFVSNLQQILEDTRLNPRLLNIEITESIAMKNFETAAIVINILKSLGISVTIDDFGTGYSSLNYLANLELDYLKIDKSLIKDLHVQTKKQSIVKGIITIAHNLGIKVVAEGVENQEELDFLKQHNCDLVQGYLISYPLPARQVVSYLR